MPANCPGVFLNPPFKPLTLLATFCLSLATPPQRIQVSEIFSCWGEYSTLSRMVNATYKHLAPKCGRKMDYKIVAVNADHTARSVTFEQRMCHFQGGHRSRALSHDNLEIECLTYRYARYQWQTTKKREGGALVASSFQVCLIIFSANLPLPARSFRRNLSDDLSDETKSLFRQAMSENHFTKGREKDALEPLCCASGVYVVGFTLVMCPFVGIRVAIRETCKI